MGFSSGNRRLNGKQLYIAVAAWLILVLAGGQRCQTASGGSHAHQ